MEMLVCKHVLCVDFAFVSLLSAMVTFWLNHTSAFAHFHYAIKLLYRYIFGLGSSSDQDLGLTSIASQGWGSTVWSSEVGLNAKYSTRCSVADFAQTGRPC
jgi:hypothetical protein